MASAIGVRTRKSGLLITIARIAGVSNGKFFRQGDGREPDRVPETMRLGGEIPGYAAGWQYITRDDVFAGFFHKPLA